ncbi:WD40-repeat-containing domain protein [Gigaspora rosea]|uniref:WD40-repeat-containing domain protein n=1 Tax=Gigaspora rosea TaxID=44941 RepID=A0A397VLT8_9GLOM|nr:WD40-repeat-containing domain protein [Gigaspora rosea]
MSSPYKKLSIKKLPVPTEKGTEESRFWKRFKPRCSLSEIASVTSIKFSPIQPFDFAVTSSTRVQIYSTQTYKVKKTISRFNDIAYCGTIRNDGKLLVAGDATGLIQVFDINSRAILRTMKGHNHPVHITRFAPGNTQILSCSDDKTARIWDIPGQETISIFKEHQDYVRAGLISNDNPHLILTGSYDQSIKLWDLRTNSCTMSMSHGAPVEDVLMFPGGGMIISAGGPTITVWDLISGGRVVRSVSNHQKTITSMCFDGSSSRLLTGSLDHHVKIYDVQNYDVVHSIEYSSPILCIALSPDDTNIVAGMTCGTLSIRRRKLVQKELNMSHQNKQPRVGSYKYFTRGQTYSGNKDDFVVESKPRERLALYDRYLKKFQYSNALDAALRNGTQAILTISLLQELIRRDALRQAIVGRDDLSLEPLVKFLIRWINEPRYTSILVDVGNVIIDVYSSVIYKSPLIEKLIVNLHSKVKTEMNLQKEIAKIIGSLEMVAKGSLLTDTTNYT